MGYIKIADDGRVTAASGTHHCGDGEIEVKIPEWIDIECIHEYRYVGGEFIYDPIPGHEAETGRTMEGRVEALEMQIASYETAYAQGVNEA